MISTKEYKSLETSMSTLIFYNSSMKYILKHDLPTFKAGTEAWLSEHGNLLTRIDDDTEITMYAHSTLAKFPTILTEWFTPVEEKRKAVPDE